MPHRLDAGLGRKARAIDAGQMMVRDERGQVNFGRGGFLIQALILLSLVAFAVETLPDLSDRWRRFLNVFERFTVTVFALEYIVRIAFSRARLRYIFSFFGIIDLLCVVPFFLASGVDMRSLKAFRLLRLFNILKLVRYSAAVRRFHRAFVISREELILFGMAAGIMLFLSATGIYYFENAAQPEKFASIFHCLWWATTTLTTVGYGDTYPVTAGGKCFTALVLMIGLGIVAVPTGLFASALSKAREDEEESRAS